MIDKQKLIKWIEDKIYVNSGPYDDVAFNRKVMLKGKLELLHTLEMDIRAGNLDIEEVAHER